MRSSHVDPAWKSWYEREQSRWQRLFLLQGKRGTKTKVRSRLVKNRHTGAIVQLFYVFAHDLTREGDDRTVGRPVLVGGPFLSEAEAEKFGLDWNQPRGTFYFGGRKFDPRPPKADRDQVLDQYGKPLPSSASSDLRAALGE